MLPATSIRITVSPVLLRTTIGRLPELSSFSAWATMAMEFDSPTGKEGSPTPTKRFASRPSLGSVGGVLASIGLEFRFDAKFVVSRSAWDLSLPHPYAVTNNARQLT